jgi:hypothetical protein
MKINVSRKAVPCLGACVPRSIGLAPPSLSPPTRLRRPHGRRPAPDWALPRSFPRALASPRPRRVGGTRPPKSGEFLNSTAPLLPLLLNSHRTPRLIQTLAAPVAQRITTRRAAASPNRTPNRTPEREQASSSSSPSSVPATPWRSGSTTQRRRGLPVVDGCVLRRRRSGSAKSGFHFILKAPPFFHVFVFLLLYTVREITQYVFIKKMYTPIHLFRLDYCFLTKSNTN